jgi:hypothetical protein
VVDEEGRGQGGEDLETHDGCGRCC